MCQDPSGLISSTHELFGEEWNVPRIDEDSFLSGHLPIWFPAFPNPVLLEHGPESSPGLKVRT